MGVFDFVRDVGAKVGIGKSTKEREEEKAAADAAAKAREVLESQADMLEAGRKARAAQEAEDAREAAAKAAKAASRRAAASERMAEYRKATELERYVIDLGIDISDIDIRFDDGTAYISGTAADQETKEKVILAVGNVEGVGKVDEEIEVAAPADEAVFHTVAAGDTLWAVAEKVYGDGSRYPEIFEANKPMLSDPDLIFPGQVLRCPK